jgi:C4-dicarboxylate transporter
MEDATNNNAEHREIDVVRMEENLNEVTGDYVRQSWYLIRPLLTRTMCRQVLAEKSVMVQESVAVGVEMLLTAAPSIFEWIQDTEIYKNITESETYKNTMHGIESMQIPEKISEMTDEVINFFQRYVIEPLMEQVRMLVGYTVFTYQCAKRNSINTVVWTTQQVRMAIDWFRNGENLQQFLDLLNQKFKEVLALLPSTFLPQIQS